MIEIEYIGEREDGTVCGSCGGSRSTPTITKKKIFGKNWEVGKSQSIPVSEFGKYMYTGLFKKV